ncbi:hypothetical protein ACQY0O_003937 [Thecaphora frezii]
MLDRQLQAALDLRRQKGTLRNLTLFPTVPCSPQAASSPSLSQPSEEPLVDFSSNDYLSLSTCPQVRSDFLRLFSASPSSKLGSTGSRLLDGNSPEHESLEHDLAEHFGSPTSLLFNSGYDANVSLLSTLPQPDDIVLYDALVHASVHDGIRKSRTASTRRIAFRHNSTHHLEQILADLEARGELSGDGNRNVFVAVESVYSMDGDVCPLRGLLDTLDRYVVRERRCVVVDEAHSTAVYGRRGRGFCDALDVSHRVDVRLMTFGKGMGASGAVVLCTPLVRHYLVNYARPLIFSTSLSFVSLLSIRACLLALQDGRSEQRARRLFRHTRRLVHKLRGVVAQAEAKRPSYRGNEGSAALLELPNHLGGVTATEGLQCTHGDADVDEADVDVAALSMASPSPIVPLLTCDARPLAAWLRQHGLLARPICYPTVPKGEDRVRICLHADNAEHDVDRLVECVRTWVMMRQQQQQQQLGRRPAGEPHQPLPSKL